jgi:hypothetical protein
MMLLFVKRHVGLHCTNNGSNILKIMSCFERAQYILANLGYCFTFCLLDGSDSFNMTRVLSKGTNVFLFDG